MMKELVAYIYTFKKKTEKMWSCAIVTTVIFLGVLGLMIGGLIVEGKEMISIPNILLVLGTGALAMAFDKDVLTYLGEIKEKEAKFRADYPAEEMLDDFHKARKMLMGYMYLGEKYIFGKRTNRVTKIADLTEIYTDVSIGCSLGGSNGRESFDLSGSIPREKIRKALRPMEKKAGTNLYYQDYFVTVVSEIRERNPSIVIGENRSMGRTRAEIDKASEEKDKQRQNKA